MLEVQPCCRPPCPPPPSSLVPSKTLPCCQPPDTRGQAVAWVLRVPMQQPRPLPLRPEVYSRAVPQRCPLGGRVFHTCKEWCQGMRRRERMRRRKLKYVIVAGCWVAGRNERREAHARAAKQKKDSESAGRCWLRFGCKTKNELKVREFLRRGDSFLGGVRTNKRCVRILTPRWRWRAACPPAPRPPLGCSRRRRCRAPRRRRAAPRCCPAACRSAC